MDLAVMLLRREDAMPVGSYRYDNNPPLMTFECAHSLPTLRVPHMQLAVDGT